MHLKRLVIKCNRIHTVFQSLSRYHMSNNISRSRQILNLSFIAMRRVAKRRLIIRRSNQSGIALSSSSWLTQLRARKKVKLKKKTSMDANQVNRKTRQQDLLVPQAMVSVVSLTLPALAALNLNKLSKLFQTCLFTIKKTDSCQTLNNSLIAITTWLKVIKKNSRITLSTISNLTTNSL